MAEFSTHELPQPPKPKSRRARAKKSSTLDRSLQAIYKNTGRRGGDMTTLERANGTRRRHLLILIAVFFAFLALIAWVVFFMFAPGGRFSGKGIELAIEGPDTVKIGDETTYVVRYTNHERLALGRATIELIIPQDFSNFNSPTPPSRGTTWDLGTIGRDTSGTIEIHGTPNGSLGAPLSLQAKLTYTPANINSEFETIARKIIEVNDSPFGLAIEGPSAVGPGDAVTYTIMTSSTEAGAWGDAIVRVKLPDHFVATAIEPKPIEGTLEWNLGQTATSTTITVRGGFTADASGESAIGAIAGVKRDSAFVIFRRQTLTTTVAPSELELSLVANGSAADTSAEPGDMLHYNLKYKNRGNRLFGDVTLAIVFRGDREGTSAPLDWSKSEDEAKGRIADGKVTWTKTQIRRLGALKPNDEGSIDFAIPIIDNPSGPGSGKVIAAVEAAIGSVEDKKEHRTVRSGLLTVTINSQAELRAEARYYSDDNEALGTGPVPPRVGERTTYRIQWKIKNSLHELADVVVEAKLGPGVSWTGKNEAGTGSLIFEPDTRRVIWSVNRMPASVLEISGSFEVAVIPTEADVGNEFTLTDATNLSGKDAVTQKPLLRSASKTTTALLGDPEFEGKGTVIGNE